MTMESEADFVEQLRQEELSKDDYNADGGTRTRVDDDGTVSEFDPVKRAWFPMIDDDFIARYQMNYGNCGTNDENSAVDSTVGATAQHATEPAVSDQHAKFYRSYYEAIERGELTAGDTPAYYDFYSKYHQQNAADGATGAATAGEGGDGKNEEIKMDADDAESGGRPARKPAVKFEPTGNKEYDDYWSHYFEHCYEEPDDAGKEEKTSAVAKQNEQAKRAKEASWFEMDQDRNTSVYVSGLPSDITDDDFKDLMLKFGLIMYDPHHRRLKLKLYKDAAGCSKGDGLCSYIKIESVDLALQILDGYQFGSQTLSVRQAQFTLKGDFDVKKKKKKLTNKEKRRAKKQQEKLLEWRLEKPSEDKNRKKHECVVIVKNLFTPHQFDKNPVLVNEIQSDLHSECSKFGDVSKVTIYDHHVDGVAGVAMKRAVDADTCRDALDGRWFGGRLLSAATWDGKASYSVTESADKREARLSKWAEFLEGGGEEAEKATPPSAAEDGATSTVQEMTSSTVDDAPPSMVEDTPPSAVQATPPSAVQATPPSAVEDGATSTVQEMTSSAVEDIPTSAVEDTPLSTVQATPPSTVEATTPADASTPMSMACSVADADHSKTTPVGSVVDSQIEVSTDERNTVSNSQTGVADSQAGVADSQTGVGDSQTGVGDSQTGVGDSQTGVGDSQTGVGDSQTGVGDSQMGVGDSQTGVGDSQTGVGDSQMCVGDSQTGVGDSKTEVRDSQSGETQATVERNSRIEPCQ